MVTANRVQEQNSRDVENHILRVKKKASCGKRRNMTQLKNMTWCSDYSYTPPKHRMYLNKVSEICCSSNHFPIKQLTSQEPLKNQLRDSVIPSMDCVEEETDPNEVPVLLPFHHLHLKTLRRQNFVEGNHRPIHLTRSDTGHRENRRLLISLYTAETQSLSSLQTGAAWVPPPSSSHSSNKHQEASA